jgi:small-conductance mechanosensitive channel
MEGTWNKSFDTKLRTYAKGMTKILDRLDRLTGKQTILEQQRARLAESPNPRKEASLKKEADELAQEEKQILEDEQELLAKVTLQSEYLPKKDKVAQK